MNNLNSLLNQQQMSSSLQEIHDHSQFDPSSHDEFLHQMLSLTSPAFPWPHDQTTSSSPHNQISSAAARAMMLQQQLRSLAAENDLRSPTDADAGFFSVPLDARDDVVPENDASIKALFNGYTESLGQTTNQAQHFHHSQADSFGVSAAAAAAAASQPATAGQPRQRVRARRGQATDPHSIAERLRRERIAERMKALQELVPNANRTDKASMLDEIIDYVKFLQLQVKVLSTSRLGGVAAASQGKNGNGAETAASSEKEGMKTTELKVAKLLEEDMGSAMQYLQGKGLCLMPISLATTISSSNTQTST